MKKRTLAVLVLLLLWATFGVTLWLARSAPAPQPEPSPTPTATPAPTPEPTPAPEPTPEPSATPTGERETVDIDALGGRPTTGQAYGTLKISGTAVDCTLYYGDGNAQLNAGAGTYTGACIPGEDGTILVAGHTGTYFRDFASLQEGADIEIETYYGTFHYEVTGMQPALATDSAAYDLTATPENIILYTCYPLGQVAPTEWRYFVYGKLTSGPRIG